MDKKLQAKELISKYHLGTASPEERLLVEQWFLIDLENSEVLPDAKSVERADRKIRANLSAHIEGEAGAARTVKLWPGFRIKPGMTGLVAAAAVTAIVLCVYFFVAPRHPDTPRHPEFVAGSQDIAPGKNGATITQANGKVIELSDEKSGVVIGGNNIRYDDGTSVGPEPEPVLLRSTEGSGSLLTASTARGQTYQFTLPDGTRVWLNADSKISFPSQFDGKERKILLSGEGYFEVVHNARMPFRVESETADGRKQVVEDIGTAFNINAYGDEAVVKTTLVEGLADVNGTRLKPNQQSVLASGNKLTVKQIDAAEAVLWKEGKFSFSSEEMGAVMKKVARWYNVEVVFAENRLALEKVSGSVSRFANLSTLLQKLEQTGGIHFNVEGKKIKVIP